MVQVALIQTDLRKKDVKEGFLNGTEQLPYSKGIRIALALEQGTRFTYGTPWDDALMDPATWKRMGRFPPKWLEEGKDPPIWFEKLMEFDLQTGQLEMMPIPAEYGDWNPLLSRLAPGYLPHKDSFSPPYLFDLPPLFLLERIFTRPVSQLEFTCILTSNWATDQAFFPTYRPIEYDNELIKDFAHFSKAYLRAIKKSRTGRPYIEQLFQDKEFLFQVSTPQSCGAELLNDLMKAYPSCESAQIIKYAIKRRDRTILDHLGIQKTE